MFFTSLLEFRYKRLSESIRRAGISGGSGGMGGGGFHMFMLELWPG
jgi:hypothetical protein